jgi:chemotaxis protein histidine kinase CheA
MNVRTAIAVMLSLTALTTGACVARSTHNAAVADLEATKAELNSTKTQSEALTEQVSELRQQSLDIAKQLDGTTLAFKRARQQREADRVALQRLNRLSHMVSQLAAQQKSMKYALQRETKAQPRLRAIVEEYKSKLDEVGGSPAPISHPLIDRADHPVETAPPAQVVAQADPAPKPTVMTQAAPATPPAANPTPPLTKRPIPEPVEEDWLSWFRNWVMSFFESILP